MGALQLPLLLSDPLDFRVGLHIQGLHEVPFDLHKVSTSTFADQPPGAPAPLTSPEPRTNPFPSLFVLESGHGFRFYSLSQTMPGGRSAASARINPLEAEDGEKNLLPREAHPADSCWLMLEGCAHHGGEDTTQKDPFVLTCLCSSFTHISGGELAL